MSSKFNIKPYHRFAQSLGSDSNSTVFYSFYQNNNKAFLDAQPLGLDSNSTTFKTSGYQYILTSASVSAVTELAGIVDSASVVITQTITELLGTVDVLATNPSYDIESAPFSDSASIVNIQTIYENLTLSDGATGNNFAGTTDSAPLVEVVTATNLQTLGEAAPLAENITTIVRLTATYGVKFTGLIRATPSYTTRFSVVQHLTNTYSTQFMGQLNNLIGITATGGTYVYAASGGAPVLQPNPFNPTLSIGGINYIGTAPAAAANTAVYVALPNTGITGLDWSQIWNFAMTLNYSGGTFSIETLPNLGGNGTTLDIFGFKGTITNPGKRLSNSMHGYTTDGIFGAPLLNKQFRLLSGSTELINQFLIRNNSGAIWCTASAVAKALAGVCGISLTWLAQDIPVTDFSYEPTMNGISAINSMAQRVGANLRWMGGNNYYVAYPNYTQGTFIVPNQKLITANGLGYKLPYDLETGIGGTVRNNAFGAPIQTLAVYNNLPVNLSALTGQYLLDPNHPQPVSGTAVGTPLVPVTTIAKKLTVDSPDSIYPLPYNYDTILVQILVNGKKYTANGAQYVTTDPGVWDIFVAPAFNSSGALGANSEYVYTTLEGGAYVKKIKIDYRCQPGHPAIDAGEFEMKIACTLKQASATPRIYYKRPTQWIKTYEGTIDVLFYGVIPMPGMLAKAVAEDITVEGVIESVNFTSAGTIQLQVAQYSGIDYLVPYLQLNNSGAIFFTN